MNLCHILFHPKDKYHHSWVYELYKNNIIYLIKKCNFHSDFNLFNNYLSNPIIYLLFWIIFLIVIVTTIQSLKKLLICNATCSKEIFEN